MASLEDLSHLKTSYIIQSKIIFSLIQLYHYNLLAFFRAHTENSHRNCGSGDAVLQEECLGLVLVFLWRSAFF